MSELESAFKGLKISEDLDKALVNACKEGNIRLVKLLVAAGAKDRNDDGWWYACTKGYRYIIPYLGS